jgi:hypothetical protein
VASSDSSVAWQCSSLSGSMDDVTSSHSNTGAWGTQERGEGRLGGGGQGKEGRGERGGRGGERISIYL